MAKKVVEVLGRVALRGLFRGLPGRVPPRNLSPTLRVAPGEPPPNLFHQLPRLPKSPTISFAVTIPVA